MSNSNFFAPITPLPEPQPAPALTREEGQEREDAQWFTKKPVTIQAKRWCGDRFEEMQAFTNNGVYWKEISSQHYLCVKTFEGEHVASVGDWIIRGVAGEFYPCKPDIFAATYSPASSPSPIPASQPASEGVLPKATEETWRWAVAVKDKQILELLDLVITYLTNQDAECHS